jgi:PAS domain S-box-containing protein
MEPENAHSTILIVDDDPSGTKVLAETFARAGHEVEIATGGREALDAARSQLPDLILLDVRLPEMDGFAVCEALKADEDLRDVPVVFISASNDVPGVIRAFEVGAVDYVTKPFYGQEVLARVNTQLSLSRQRREIQRLHGQDRRRLEQLAHEIEQRRQTETALRESQRQLETMLGNLRGMAYRCQNDRDWTMRFVSAGSLDLTGYPPEDLIGNRRVAYGDLIHPGDRAYVWDQVQAALRAKRHFWVTYRLITASGEEKWVWEQGIGTPGPDPDNCLIEGLVMDITRQRQAEESLRIREAHYSELFNHLGSGVAVYQSTPDGQDFTFKDMNRASERLTGVSKQDIVGRSVKEVFHSVESFGLLAVFRQVWETGQPQRLPASLYQDDHLTAWFENYVFRMTTGEIVSVYDDVSERVRVQENYDRLVSLSSDLICVAGFDGYFKILNPAWEKTLGYPMEELLARPFAEILHPDDRGTVNDRIKGITSDDGAFEHESRLVHRDGTVRTFEWKIIPLQAEEVMYCIGRDVTRQKETESALKGYSELLEDMVRTRTAELHAAQEQLVRKEKLAVLGQLSGSVGHELRNPLGVIVNAVYFLRAIMDEPDESVQEYLDIIPEAVHSAQHIVTHLLDFSRTRPAEREHIELATLVGRALNQQPPPENVRVVDDIPADLPGLFVDPHQIEQAVINLISNACQAMPDGGDLIFRAEALDGEVRLVVADTGVGISEENLGRIFEPLFTTRAKGVGLGLAIVENLIAVNGGRITVSSTSGEGTAFTLVLPTAWTDNSA